MTPAHLIFFLALCATILITWQLGLRLGIAVCDSVLSRLGRRVPKVGAQTIMLPARGYARYKKGDRLLVFDAFTAKYHRIVAVDEEADTITVEPV